MDRDAPPEAVAEACGIKLAGAPLDRVPLRPVRETGRVTCNVCGSDPDPPFRPVARWDDETVRCYECEAARRPLGEHEAQALVLAECGWTASDLDSFGSPIATTRDGRELLRNARR
jgi:hypothetical protein